MSENYDFVKGSDFYKGYYEQNVVETVYVRYYQISLFNQNGKRMIRSYLFKGEGSKGACFYNYKIIEMKDYSITEKKLNIFLENLNSNKQNNGIRIKHKFYPVYTFEYVAAPTGNEINECVSELLV